MNTVPGQPTYNTSMQITESPAVESPRIRAAIEVLGFHEPGFTVKFKLKAHPGKVFKSLNYKTLDAVKAEFDSTVKRTDTLDYRGVRAVNLDTDTTLFETIFDRDDETDREIAMDKRWMAEEMADYNRGL